MQELITVIVPVYNVKPYLEECLDTILAQTYKKLEVIIIDDGSTDGSGEICDLYVKKDSRIKVIHQKNAGVSEARNTGLKEASGEYIGFVDPDDRIHNRMYECLMDKMEEYQSDIVYCQHNRITENEPVRNIDDTTEMKVEIRSAKDVLRMILSREMQEYVWCALWKRELISDIYFEKGRKYEDSLWTYQVIGRAKKIVFIDKKLYDYRQRVGSLVNSKYTLKDLDLLYAREQIVEYVTNNFNELRITAIGCLQTECMNQYNRSRILTDLGEKQIVHDVVNKCRKRYSLKVIEILSDKYMKTSRKIWMLSCKISFTVMCWIKYKIIIFLEKRY